MCILRVILALCLLKICQLQGGPTKGCCPWTPLGALCSPKSPAFQDWNTFFSPTSAVGGAFQVEDINGIGDAGLW